VVQELVRIGDTAVSFFVFEVLAVSAIAGDVVLAVVEDYDFVDAEDGGGAGYAAGESGAEIVGLTAWVWG